MASSIKRILLVGYIAACLAPVVSRAETDEPSIDPNVYDDLSAFEGDPVQLDEEVSRYFGRFFETSFLVGTGIFTGELGEANSAGLNVGVRFVFFFDKLFAGELGVGYDTHTTIYNAQNTGVPNVNIQLNTVLIPITLGIRYAFDRENLPRGISLMNPYLAIGGELDFRAEGVQGTPVTTGLSQNVQDKFEAGAVVNTTAYGANVGGGFEFDVYKNKAFLGLDLRYHFLFWPDAGVLIGNLGRNGDYVTIQGMFSYNY